MRARAQAGSHALSDADYHALLERQGGGCAICGATPKTRRLHTDRDHKTLAVRGLLCHRCNRALPGWVTIGWLTRAAAYLYRATHCEDVAGANEVASAPAPDEETADEVGRSVRDSQP